MKKANNACSLKRLKRSVLCSTMMAALSLLVDFLIVRHAAVIFSAVLEDLTPYFEGLTRALIGWDPLWMPLVLVGGGTLLWLPQKKGLFAVMAPIVMIIYLAAGLLFMRVNSIPALKMIGVILSLVQGGVI